MDAEKNTFSKDFKNAVKTETGSGKTEQPEPRSQGSVTADGVDLKKSFLYSRLEVMRNATEGFSYEQLSNVAQNLASVDCEKFAKAHPDFPAFNELMYIRSGIEEPGTEGYDRLAIYAGMFSDPVSAITRAVDEMGKWCDVHPGDSLAQVILGQFEELRGDRESVNRRLYQVLQNESAGFPTEDAMLLWAQLGIICDFDGWISRNFGISTPVKSEAEAPKAITRGGEQTSRGTASAVSGKLAGLVDGLPMIRKVAFFASAGAAVLYLLSMLSGSFSLVSAVASALLAYLILKGKDMDRGSTLMAVPKTLTAALSLLGYIRVLRWRPGILSLLPLLLGAALAAVLWLSVLGRMTDRRKLAVLLVGGFAVEILLTLVAGRFYGFFGLLAALGFNAAHLLIAYLTFKDALKKK